MLKVLTAFLAGALVLSACNRPPETQTPAPETEAQGLLQTPVAGAPEEVPSSVNVSEPQQILPPGVLLQQLKDTFVLPADERPITVIRESGISPSAQSAVDLCVEKTRFQNATEAVCFGLILKACPGMEGSTSDMVMCLSQEYDYWDARLNRTYKALMPLLKTDDDEMGEDGVIEVSLVEEAKKAQRAWIEFRDAQCGYERKRFRGGTLGRVTVSDCMWRLTARRALELEEMLTNTEPH